MVTVTQTPNNRFAISKGDTILKTYARRRDAVRGATRMGFTVA